MSDLARAICRISILRYGLEQIAGEGCDHSGSEDGCLNVKGRSPNDYCSPCFAEYTLKLDEIAQEKGEDPRD